MNSLVKDALKLVIITVVAGLVLGAVYGITKKPIADQEAKAQMEGSLCGKIMVYRNNKRSD